jgi:hypothetical protein
MPYSGTLASEFLTHLADTHTLDTLRYTNAHCIRRWFGTGTMNDPDRTDPIVHIGWLQLLSSYITNDWSMRQVCIKDNTKVQNTMQANSGRIKLFLYYGCTATPFGNIGVQLHIHLEKTGQTTVAISSRSARFPHPTRGSTPITTL